MSPRPLLRLLTAAGLVLAATLARAEDAPAPTVATPARRQADLTAAQQLLFPTATEIPAGLPDPFHSDAFSQITSTAAPAGPQAGPASGTEPGVAPKAARPAGPRTGSELLAALAGGLRPSGYFVLGGEPTLVFGQKRVKAGGVLNVTYEGTEYTLEVTAVTRTNFTLRLNNEEFTRPIK